MKRKLIYSLAAALLIAGPVAMMAQGQQTSPAQAKQAVQTKVEQLAGKTFANCSFGCYAIYDNGEVIVARGEHHRLNPASNMKVITTACALTTLGPDYRWTTRLAYSGTIDETGTLNGDLYIIGGGDPTLAAENKPVSAEDRAKESFAQWKTLLDKAGIRKINGSILTDSSWMDGEREEPSWLIEDVGTYYGAQVSGLNFHENRQNFKVTAGAGVGDKLSITPLYPHTPWMQWEYGCSTGEAKTGDKLFLYQNYGTFKGVITGTYGVDGKGKALMCRNNYPELTAAYEFYVYLQNVGLPVAVDPSSKADCEAAASHKLAENAASANNLIPLGEVKSLRLKDVVDKTNKDSDNFYAEMLLRTMGKENGGSACIKASREAMGTAVRGIYPGYPATEIAIRDGSGLSCQNQISPYFLGNFLRQMTLNPQWENFRASLVKANPRVWLKTGSMQGCRTLCGYILPSSPQGRTIIFSIMVGHSSMGVYSIDRQERSLIEALEKLN